jgi:hypothetical protein
MFRIFPEASKAVTRLQYVAAVVISQENDYDDDDNNNSNNNNKGTRSRKKLRRFKYTRNS